MSRIITPSEVAQQLDVTEADLAFWRGAGLGPVWLQFGEHAIRYVDDAVHAWVIGQLEQTEPTLHVSSSENQSTTLQTEQLPGIDSDT